MPTQSIASKVKYVISNLRSHAVHDTSTHYGDLVLPTSVIHRAANNLDLRLGPNGQAKLNGRFTRGLVMARSSMVSACEDPDGLGGERLYQVQSSDPSKPPYRVDLGARICNCPDNMKGHFCKHLVAAIIIDDALRILKRYGKDVPQVSEITPDPPVEAAAPTPQGESIIWAAIRHNGSVLGVEVMNLDGEMATVRALPVIKDDKKLQPQFPFEGKTSLAVVPKKDLFHVRVFQ